MAQIVSVQLCEMKLFFLYQEINVLVKIQFMLFGCNYASRDVTEFYHRNHGPDDLITR